MLSRVDIMQELGDEILIHPLNLGNIKGSSINLSVGNHAWSLKTKKSIVADGKVVIPENDTAFILTKECLYVSDRISGTYHSRVTLTAKGLGHVGTTLDPNWIGCSLVMIHNHSDVEIPLKIGSPFVTVTLHYLSTPSIDNPTYKGGRPELLNDFECSDEYMEWIDNGWQRSSVQLKEQMEGCDEYENLLAIKTRGSLFSSPTSINLLIFLVVIFIMCVFWVYKHYFPENSDFEMVNIVIPLICAYFGMIGAQLSNYIHNKSFNRTRKRSG